jgi:hypothetical protein
MNAIERVAELKRHLAEREEKTAMDGAFEAPPQPRAELAHPPAPESAWEAAVAYFANEQRLYRAEQCVSDDPGWEWREAMQRIGRL